MIRASFARSQGHARRHSGRSNTLKVSAKCLVGLALFAAVAGSPGVHATDCAVSGGTLAAARAAYVEQCPSIPRVDCDPVAGNWTCASYRMGRGGRVAPDLSAPTSAPTPAPTPVPGPTTDAPDDTPSDRPTRDDAAGGGTAAEPPRFTPSGGGGGERDTSQVKLPLRLDNLYKYNVTAVTNMWTEIVPSGVSMQIVSFYDERKRVHIATREFPHGEFGEPIDIDEHVHPGDTLEFDSHNNTGVAIAPDGTVFVTANHHVDELNLAKTARPYDLTSFVNVPASSLGQGIVERITYPSFFKLDGYLWLSAREQDVGGGTNYFMWHLWRYNHDTGEWDIRTRLNGGQRLRLYISNVDWSADESEIHFLGVWRDDFFRTGLSQNTDLFHLTSRDGISFEHVDGTPVDLPLVRRSDRNRASAADHEVPVTVWDTAAGDPQPYQPGSVIYDGAGTPHMLIKEIGNGRRDTWHHRWDAGRRGWVSRKTGLATHTDDLVSLPDGRVGMLGHANDAIYFLDLSTPDAERVLIAKGFHTRDFDVNVGKTEMRFGYLSIWLTENGHSPPRSQGGSRPADAWVLTIGLDQLSEFDRPLVR